MRLITVPPLKRSGLAFTTLMARHLLADRNFNLALGRRRYLRKALTSWLAQTLIALIALLHKGSPWHSRSSHITLNTLALMVCPRTPPRAAMAPARLTGPALHTDAN